MVRFVAGLSVAILAAPMGLQPVQAESPRYLRGAYVSIFASAANPTLNNVRNESTGRFARAVVTKPNASDGVIFAPSAAIGYNLRQVGFPMRIEAEYTIRGKTEYREPLSFAGVAVADMDSVVENQSLMANLFIDIERAFWGFKPFVGWGLGVAWNDADYRFRPLRGPGPTLAGSDRSATFAWSAMAGAGLPFGRAWSFDIRYRYADLGEVIWNPQTVGADMARLQAEDLTTHEFGIGLRYTF